MEGRTMGVEEIVEAILRGAAKLLGFPSAELVEFDEASRVSRLRVGAMAASDADLRVLELDVGVLRGAEFPFEVLEDSAVYRSWKERVVIETNGLVELVGSAIPRDVVQTIDERIGDHRFICVPVLAGQRCPGVLLTEMTGRTPFSPQQREILLRYAERIGELVVGASGWRVGDGGHRVLLDREGRVVGGSDPATDAAGEGGIEPAWLASVRERALRLFEGDPGAAGDADGRGDRARLERVEVRGEALAMATLPGGRSRDDEARRRLLRLAVGESGPAILVDSEFRITSANPAAGRLLGYGNGELGGLPVAGLFHDPDGVRTLLDHQFLFLSDGRSEEALVLRRRDGSLFPARVESMVLADDADRVVGFVVLIRAQPAALEGTPAQTDARALMRRERLATMGEMAAQLAHEVRNPLVAIGATLESVAADLADRPELRDVLASLQGEVTRMDMTLRDYLSLATRQNTAVRKLDLGSVVEDAMRLLNLSRRGRDGRVVSAVPPGLEVLGDPDGLRHVFFNLLLNALDAMPEGGEVRVSATADPGVVTVRVDDAGPGLSCGSERCFEPFFTTKKHGTGLGLTVCQKLVAAHGGTLTLANRKEGGCRATVALPRRSGG